MWRKKMNTYSGKISDLRFTASQVAPSGPIKDYPNSPYIKGYADDGMRLQVVIDLPSYTVEQLEEIKAFFKVPSNMNAGAVSDGLTERVGMVKEIEHTNVLNDKIQAIINFMSKRRWEICKIIGIFCNESVCQSHCLYDDLIENYINNQLREIIEDSK
jgi:hypothetical protein